MGDRDARDGPAAGDPARVERSADVAGAPEDARAPAERPGTGVLSVAKSVGAALIGVQSSKNRERDFAEGKPAHFVIGGLIGTLVFLLAIWLLVQYLIATS